MCTTQLQLATSQQWFQWWEVGNTAHNGLVCIEGLTQQKDGLGEVTSYWTTPFRLSLGRCIFQQLKDMFQC